MDTPEYWDALAQEYTDKVCSSYDDCATNAVRDALDSVACPSAVAVDFGTGPGKVRRDGWCWEYAVTAPSQRHSVWGEVLVQWGAARVRQGTRKWRRRQSDGRCERHSWRVEVEGSEGFVEANERVVCQDPPAPHIP